MDDCLVFSEITNRLLARFSHFRFITNLTFIPEDGRDFAKVYFQWEGDEYYISKDFRVTLSGGKTSPASILLESLLRGE